MRQYTEKPYVVLSMEKDHPENITKMQLRAWKLNNGTTVLLRILNPGSTRKPWWSGKLTIQGTHSLLLRFLQDRQIISDEGNWEYSPQIGGACYKEDEFEEKEECMYFCWEVKKRLIKF